MYQQDSRFRPRYSAAPGGSAGRLVVNVLLARLDGPHTHTYKVDAQYDKLATTATTTVVNSRLRPRYGAAPGGSIRRLMVKALSPAPTPHSHTSAKVDTQSDGDRRRSNQVGITCDGRRLTDELGLHNFRKSGLRGLVCRQRSACQTSLCNTADV